MIAACCCAVRDRSKKMKSAFSLRRTTVAPLGDRVRRFEGRPIGSGRPAGIVTTSWPFSKADRFESDGIEIAATWQMSRWLRAIRWNWANGPSSGQAVRSALSICAVTCLVHFRAPLANCAWNPLGHRTPSSGEACAAGAASTPATARAAERTVAFSLVVFMVVLLGVGWVWTSEGFVRRTPPLSEAVRFWMHPSRKKVPRGPVGPQDAARRAGRHIRPRGVPVGPRRPLPV